MARRNWINPLILLLSPELHWRFIFLHFHREASGGTIATECSRKDTSCLDE